MKIYRNSRLRHPDESGFSLVEVMISMVVLGVGLVGLLGVFGLAIAANQSAQEDMIARQVASEAMESIFTARNTSQLSFSQINNVAFGGIFANGAQSLLCAGPTYGIVGVAGDTSACKTSSGANCPNGGVKCLDEPGADGILGTSDDVIDSLANFTRTIAITPLTDSSGSPIQTLSQVTITINYSAPNSSVNKNYVLEEFISEYH
ncbi:MAG: prepilin-type N-terminal cleavage/methylation domain-containing protein [Candidatus Sulfotelmatobacter sp.]|jgi:prepilin-type N-terminal cleavage/methylation domain-containing protein